MRTTLPYYCVYVWVCDAYNTPVLLCVYVCDSSKFMCSVLTALSCPAVDSELLRSLSNIFLILSSVTDSRNSVSVRILPVCAILDTHQDLY